MAAQQQPDDELSDSSPQWGNNELPDITPLPRLSDDACDDGCETPVAEDAETLPDITMLDGSEPSEAETAVPWSRELSALRDRMISVRANAEREKRFMALPSAWVIVFDADTEEEAVYSMEIDQGHGEEEQHVVLAFEDATDAERYAASLADEPFASPATVQQLDFEALVVTSRDADFHVAVVFRGDLDALPTGEAGSSSLPILTTGGGGEALSASITMVPDELFSEKSPDDYLDPAEDPIWVLVHDAGTADQQYFSMVLNGSDSVVCFRDEDAAARCGQALQTTGALRSPSTVSVLLEDLLEGLDDETDVCLVEEVNEHLLDSSEVADGAPAVIASDEDDVLLGTVGLADASRKCSATPTHVLDTLNKLYNAANSSAVNDDGMGGADGTPDGA